MIPVLVNQWLYDAASGKIWKSISLQEVPHVQETMEKGTGHSEIFTSFYLAIKNKMNSTNHVREKIKHNVTHQSKH